MEKIENRKKRLYSFSLRCGTVENYEHEKDPVIHVLVSGRWELECPYAKEIKLAGSRHHECRLKTMNYMDYSGSLCDNDMLLLLRE